MEGLAMKKSKKPRVGRGRNTLPGGLNTQKKKRRRRSPRGQKRKKGERKDHGQGKHSADKNKGSDLTTADYNRGL